MLYQQFNTSSTTQAAGPDAENSQQNRPSSHFVPDPPLFEYPSAERYPSVFFTAVLQEWTSPQGLGAADQVRSARVLSTAAHALAGNLSGSAHHNVVVDA